MPDISNSTGWKDPENGRVYREKRPPHPKEVYEVILRAAGIAAEPRAAGHDGRRLKLLDIACGTGQVFDSIAGYFDECYGVDASEGQLASAVQRPNVTYIAGFAESFELPGGCAAHTGTFDLITVASALHWLDAGALGAHVSPLLRPGGVLCIFGPGFSYSAAVQPLIDELRAFIGQEECWAPGRENRRNRNSDQLPLLQDPALGFGPLETFDVPLTRPDVGAETVAGIMSTMSGVQNYNRKYPAPRTEGLETYSPGCDVIDVLTRKLRQLQGPIDMFLNYQVRILRKQ